MTMDSEGGLRSTGWWLWLKWVVASTLGMVIGFVATFFLTGLAVEALLGESADEILGQEALPFFVALTVVFTGAGAAMGFMQWLVIRSSVPQAAMWVLATALGFAVLAALFGALSGVASELMNEIVHNAVGGAVAGTIQWRILRSQVLRAGWWIPASSLGFVAAGGMNYLLGGSPFGMVIGIVVMAAITGAALVTLLSSPVRDVPPAA